MCHGKTDHVSWVMVHEWHAEPRLSDGKGGLRPRLLVDE
jgi:hypothetical protein